MRKVSWATIKQEADARNLSIQWVDEEDHYFLSLVDGPYRLRHVIAKVSPASADQTDFENNYKANGNAKVDNNTYQATDLNVITQADQNIIDGQSPVVVTSSACPTTPGNKWRTELVKQNVTLSTSSYTTLKTLSNGTLTSFVLDFTSDRVDVKLTIDGQDVFDIDLDDLEDGQTSGSSSAAQNTGGAGIMYVKTGSRFCFNPPCGLTYSSLTISAKGESSNRKLSSYLIHYVVD